MNFFMLIPGIFTFLEKIIGPLLTSKAAGTIAGGLVGIASNPTVSNILNVVEGAVGKLEDEKIAQLKAEVQLILAQLTAADSDSKTSSIFAHWHAIFCGTIALIVSFHFAVAEILNVLVAAHVGNFGSIAPLDTATLCFMGTVLGVTGVGKIVERVNSNPGDDN